MCICVYVVAYPADNAESSRQQRHADDHHDIVDFGAHTGEKGSFGWYADYPVPAHADWSIYLRICTVF